MSGATPVQAKSLLEAVVSGAATSNELVAAVAGKKIVVHRIFFTLASSTTFQFKSAATALTGAMTGTEFKLDMSEYPWMKTAAGEALNLALGAEEQCSGRIYYSTE